MIRALSTGALQLAAACSMLIWIIPWSTAYPPGTSYSLDETPREYLILPLLMVVPGLPFAVALRTSIPVPAADDKLCVAGGRWGGTGLCNGHWW